MNLNLKPMKSPFFSLWTESEFIEIVRIPWSSFTLSTWLLKRHQCRFFSSWEIILCPPIWWQWCDIMVPALPCQWLKSLFTASPLTITVNILPFLNLNVFFHIYSILIMCFMWYISVTVGVYFEEVSSNPFGGVTENKNRTNKPASKLKNNKGECALCTKCLFISHGGCAKMLPLD